MLTGPELIAKVKELGDCSKSDLVRSCGYVSIKKDGSERLNFTAFYEALLAAKGVEVGLPSKAGRSGRGRKLTFTTKVQFNGNLMIGKAYTAQLDLKPGDQFQIKLGRRAITLIPMGSDGEETDQTTPDAQEQGDVVPAPVVVTEAATAAAFGAADVAIPDSSDLMAERELATVS